jgi:hypothetical protein
VELEDARAGRAGGRHRRIPSCTALFTPAPPSATARPTRARARRRSPSIARARRAPFRIGGPGTNKLALGNCQVTRLRLALQPPRSHWYSSRRCRAQPAPPQLTTSRVDSFEDGPDCSVRSAARRRRPGRRAFSGQLQSTGAGNAAARVLQHRVRRAARARWAGPAISRPRAYDAFAFSADPVGTPPLVSRREHPRRVRAIPLRQPHAARVRFVAIVVDDADPAPESDLNVPRDHRVRSPPTRRRTASKRSRPGAGR